MWVGSWPDGSLDWRTGLEVILRVSERRVTPTGLCGFFSTGEHQGVYSVVPPPSFFSPRQCFPGSGWSVNALGTAFRTLVLQTH